MATLVAYIPALHKGYLDFFKKYKGGELHILDLGLVREIPRLERDIRALDAGEIKKVVESLEIFSKVSVLSKEGIKDLESVNDIVMPDEDVSRQFAETYLGGRKIDFASVFLRWDKHSALKEKIQTSPDRIISEEALDTEIMGKAYDEAKKSSDWWRQIGAIIVKDGKVLFVGHNRPLPSDQVHNIFGDPRSNFDYGVSFELSKFIHAEAGIIAEAAKKGVALEGSSLYVTTFPCPVCAKSVAVAGIKKIYYKEGYSLLDAEDILKSYGVELIQVK
jgi:dCMP deaminase